MLPQAPKTAADVNLKGRKKQKNTKRNCCFRMNFICGVFVCLRKCVHQDQTSVPGSAAIRRPPNQSRKPPP